MGEAGARRPADLDADQDSNVKFLRPRGEVLASWRRTIAHAYAPERLFARFRYQVDATYANRLRLPAKGKLTTVNLKRGAVLAWNIVWRIGSRIGLPSGVLEGGMARATPGQIESIFGMGFVAWHLIQFTQEALGGRQSASFYAAKQYSTEDAFRPASGVQTDRPSFRKRTATGWR